MTDYIATHWQGLAFAFGIFVAMPTVLMLGPTALFEAAARRRHYRELRREVHALREENLRLARENKALALPF